MDRTELAERLAPAVVYSILEAQRILDIPACELRDAAANGDVARYLGEGLNMHFLGVDLQDWLRGRDPWPDPLSETRLYADTTGYRCRRQSQRRYG